MNIKICRLVDGTMAVGNMTDDYLCDAASLVVESKEESNDVYVIPFMYPFSKAILGINIPYNRIMCVLNDTPTDVSKIYSDMFETKEVVKEKPKASLIRIK